MPLTRQLMRPHVFAFAVPPPSQLSSTNGSFSLQAFPEQEIPSGISLGPPKETRGNGNARRINKWSADKERGTRKSVDRERERDRPRKEERIRARKREEGVERDSKREREREGKWALPASRKTSRDFMAAQGVARARAEYEDIPQMHFVNKARPAKSQQTFMSWPKKSRKKLRGKSKRK